MEEIDFSTSSAVENHGQSLKNLIINYYPAESVFSLVPLCTLSLQTSKKKRTMLFFSELRVPFILQRYSLLFKELEPCSVTNKQEERCQILDLFMERHGEKRSSKS